MRRSHRMIDFGRNVLLVRLNFSLDLSKLKYY